MRFDVTCALVFTVVCVSLQVNECMADNAHELARLGGQLNSAEKAALEEQVAETPNDIEARTTLLGYYFSQGRREPDAMAARYGPCPLVDRKRSRIGSAWLALRSDQPGTRTREL